MNWEGDDETLDLKDTEYGALAKSGIPVHLMIDIPANVQGHLVTAVYDWNSGKAGTVEVPLSAKQAVEKSQAVADSAFCRPRRESLSQACDQIQI